MKQKTSRADVRLRVPQRHQMEMQMAALDDLVPARHPVRTIWEISGMVDLSAFYEPIKARQGVVGRDATDPRLLFSLWLYGTTRGVGSARELDRLCKECKPYEWLCGGVSVNYHTLADFRVEHGEALDKLFTSVLATLVDKKLVKVYRISQDGTRVRACAGTSSFRSQERLEQLLAEAQAHVEELKKQLDDPAKGGGQSARRRSAKLRAAKEHVQRLQQAADQLPELQERHEKLLKKAGKGKHGQKVAARKVRASSTDPEARKMRMGDGGYRPAYNVQLAVDTESRAIVGVAISNEGSDSANLSEPMRKQVEQRCGQSVKEHLLDGGYAVLGDVQRAQGQDVTLFVPPPPPRNTDKREDAFQPRDDDSPAIAAWRERMGTPEAQKIYQERASTVETTNGDLKTHRGLNAIGLVKGSGKALCVALWSALAYNLMHFGHHLL